MTSPIDNPKPARLVRLLFAVCLIPFTIPVFAQSYRVVPNITTLPAGIYGVNIHALLPGDTSATPDIRLCVYTGYGSAAPISANVFFSTTAGVDATFDVLPSTIQEVPPASFASGKFPAVMYTVPLTTATCTGSAQASPGTAVTLTLEYPKITSLNLASAPRQNPELARRLPAKVELNGSNFVQQSTSTFNTPSEVVFATSSAGALAVDGNVAFISPSDLLTTFPATLSSDASSVALTVCNTAVYSYCSDPYTLSLTPLEPAVGTVTPSLSAASASQVVSFRASFRTGTPSVSGAPSAQVKFTDNGTLLYSAPLLLDSTAAFVAAPATAFKTTSATLQPIVGDFNKDGVPDILYVEPRAVTNGSTFLVIHLLLGTTPAGQFAADVLYTGLKSHPCATLLGTAVADFNLDGYPDLALLCSNPNQVGPPSAVIYTLLNRKDGVFSSSVTAYSPVFGSSIVAGDFNKDGKQDLVIAGPLDAAGDTGLQVLLGNGTGGFDIGPISTGLDTAASQSFGGFQIAAADLNGDGFPDIAILNGASSGGAVDRSIQLFQNDGSGSFAQTGTVQTDGTATATFIISALSPGEMPALIVTSSDSSAPGVSVALNHGTPAISYLDSMQFTPVAGLKQAIVGDFNGDGFPDLAITDATSTRILTGDGAGLFSTSTYPALSLPAASGSTMLAASDVNGDGYADLLAAVTGTGSRTVHDYIVAGTATASTPGLRLDSGVHLVAASTYGTVEIAPATVQTSVTVTGIASTIAVSLSASASINYGSPLTLRATVGDPTATGTISFYNGAVLVGTAQLAAAGTTAIASYTAPALAAATYSFTAGYSGDAFHSSVTSAALPFIVNPIPATLSWTPNPATIGFDTPLASAQLDAVATGVAGASVPGTFVYSPAPEALLKLGPQPLSVTFTPSSSNYTAVSAASSITVVKAAPVITWATPTNVIVDTSLSSTQLDATAATPQGAELAGTFVYTPASGTQLSVAGTARLSVIFTPTDTTDYDTATASVSINVGPIGISNISPSSALLGDAAKTISITGTGFSSTSVAQIVGPSLPATALQTKYISSTSLTAVIPTADFGTVQTLLLSIVDPTKDLPSNSLPISVAAPSTSVGYNGPTTISPASQNTVIFHLAPYPAPITASVVLTFRPTGSLPDDPGIVFTTGIRTFSSIVPAHPAELDLPVTFQSGTISGTLTLVLHLEAGGADVTPTSNQPIIIEEPVAVPGISSVSLSRDGDLLTVTTRGYSNTRKLTGAAFHFTASSGNVILTPELTLDVTSLFSTWYADLPSDQYGSLFSYTATFNLNSDASAVGQVTVTLTNDVGASQDANTP